MTARRPRGPAPGPGRDFRAVAADRPQRALPLPVVIDGAPDTSADVTIALQRTPGGRVLRLRCDLVLADPEVARRLLERLTRAVWALGQDVLATPTAATRQAPHEVTVRALVIRHETDAHGRRVAIVSGVGTDAVAHALDLRTWARQLSEAADRIEGRTP